ncbi:hypothetical protein [Clostridium sp. AF32-12BH]|uniref:hypothetical protein n=1 Tax=Clostridium sp. AF32-12BH TaxID=2292006 RepID=UPI000E5374A2|nr:hypothetical protein [Clostridium sp. AF32-12BH]RHP46964.1 hypothetical protein DWZ40_08650 [Clostridium sp. AF32-12BH]
MIAEELNYIAPNEEIEAAIHLLESNGYVIGRNYDHLVGKWVAFHQEGMKPILHGKVEKVLRAEGNGLCRVRCSNGVMRWVYATEALEFFYTKRECYGKYEKGK